MASQADLLIHKPIGTENCLHLSVYTHDIKPRVLKPVMVWIHGGAFIVGGKAKEYYNPEFLLRKDIVLIAMNYRLGAFGKPHEYPFHQVRDKLFSIVLIFIIDQAFYH